MNRLLVLCVLLLPAGSSAQSRPPIELRWGDTVTLVIPNRPPPRCYERTIYVRSVGADTTAYQMVDCPTSDTATVHEASR